jgi:hypothetical protein
VIKSGPMYCFLTFQDLSEGPLFLNEYLDILIT